MSTELTAEIDQAREALSQSLRQCHAWEGQAKMLKEEQGNQASRKEESEAKVVLLDKTQAVLHQLEETWRGRYEEGLAGLGSQGLNAVFTDDEYKVLLESTTKRDTTNLDIVLEKNGERVRLKGGSGGSVVQVLAYLLRHLTTVSHRPALRLLEALDEPFSMVAAEQRPALCALVKEITERLGFQLIFSSHEDELLDAADVAILVRPGGKVELLKSPEMDRS